jgi:antibiotic biosynthesis monooxygenase (ABM) superfamily enzyme
MVEQLGAKRPNGATSVITRIVKPGSEKAFEEWIHGIAQEAAKFPGHHSVTIFRHSPEEREYTFVLHFDRQENLKRWLDSDVRREWIDRSIPLTEVPEERAEVTGVEHWFTLPGKQEARRPAKLKMVALTILAVYPTILTLNYVLSPIFRRVPALLAPLIVTFCLTLLLTYVLMPNLTKVFHGWLYPDPETSK